MNKELTSDQVKKAIANKVEEVTQLVSRLKETREELYQLEKRLHEMTDPTSPFIEDDLF